MKKTINSGILIIISMLLFSGFLFSTSSRALDNYSIEIFNNIYNATSVINAEFTYEVVANSTNSPGALNEPTSLVINFDNVIPSGNMTTRSAMLDFSATTYETTGIYKYTIREASSSNSEFPVSDTEYEIYVVASAAGKNVYHLAKNLADGSKGEINFNHSNGYTYATVEMTTIGDAVDREEYFRYKIEFGAICQGCSYDIIGQDEYVTYNNQVIKTSDFYTAGGENYMYIYLKNGQTVDIGLSKNSEKQIPIGTMIKISIDENLNPRKWTASIDDREVDFAEFVLSEHTIIRIVAERNLLVPNTGLFGELWPFTALIVVGAVGILIFIFTRKKDANN